MARADALIFTLYEWLRLGIAWIFILGIALVSGRALIIGLLALIEKLRPAPPEHPDFQPPVSVLIPAYNEEGSDREHRAIGAGIATIRYLEVVVVNDGSADRTGELLDTLLRRRSARAHHSPAEPRQVRGAHPRAARGAQRDSGDHRRRHLHRAGRHSANWCAISPIRTSARWPAT